ncbi:MAG: hypothetical protein KJO29_09085 [Bacteroidia bacterium]|nr:hypothetical protein [Bacteroidia bacterium]
MEDYKRSIYLALIFIALGIVMKNNFENVETAGTVFIALGGLFLIFGLAKKAGKL